MKGLLLKELYFYRANGIIYLILCLCFVAGVIGTGNPFFFFFAFLMSEILPGSVIAYDEKSKWQQYCATLPVPRKAYVDVKYITMLMLFVLSCAIVTVCVAIHSAATGFKDLDGFRALLPCAALFLVFVGVFSLVMPFIFKLGAEKGRFLYMIFGGIAGGVASIGFSALADGGAYEVMLSISQNDALLLAAAAAVGALLFAGSYALSVRFYNKREL